MTPCTRTGPYIRRGRLKSKPVAFRGAQPREYEIWPERKCGEAKIKKANRSRFEGRSPENTEYGPRGNVAKPRPKFF